jgi:hypothetical protein
VAWVLVIPLLLLLLLLAALPVILMAVAVRPSHATLRVAGITLLALPVVVVGIVGVGAIV